VEVFCRRNRRDGVDLKIRRPAQLFTEAIAPLLTVTYGAIDWDFERPIALM